MNIYPLRCEWFGCINMKGFFGQKFQSMRNHSKIIENEKSWEMFSNLRAVTWTGVVLELCVSMLWVRMNQWCTNMAAGSLIYVGKSRLRRLNRERRKQRKLGKCLSLLKILDNSFFNKSGCLIWKIYSYKDHLQRTFTDVDPNTAMSPLFAFIPALK